MGADYKGQEVGIKIFRALFAMPWAGRKAREFLCHHLRNCFTVVAGQAYLLDRDAQVGTPAVQIKARAAMISKAIDHATADLKKIGC